MHILPVDELRRQFESGEISKDYYESMRATQPAPPPRLCDTPGCHRTADRMDRGKALCSVCCLIATGKRKRGLGS